MTVGTTLPHGGRHTVGSQRGDPKRQCPGEATLQQRGGDPQCPRAAPRSAGVGSERIRVFVAWGDVGPVLCPPLVAFPTSGHSRQTDLSCRDDATLTSTCTSRRLRGPHLTMIVSGRPGRGPRGQAWRACGLRSAHVFGCWSAVGPRTLGLFLPSLGLARYSMGDTFPAE